VGDEMCSANPAFVPIQCACLSPIRLDARHDNGPFLNWSAQIYSLGAGCRQIVFIVGLDLAFELARF
jgi:hypothetical protein